MAYEDFSKCITLVASADLSGSQYCFVSLNASGLIEVTGDGLDAIGVLEDDPAAINRAACVMSVPGGITKIKVGAAVNAGDDVGSDNSGRAVPAATGDRILGFMLESATAANQIVAMVFKAVSSKAT